MKKCRYDKDQLIEAIKNSVSYAGVCRKLNIKPIGGNYKTIKYYISEYKIDVTHFTGQSWNKGENYKNISKKKPIEFFLTANSNHNTSHLKNRLFKEGLKEKKCEETNCFLKEEWLGKQISLELEHINGNKFDNRLENLKILCPNCHSQTSTYRGRSKKYNISSGGEAELVQAVVLNTTDSSSHVGSIPTFPTKKRNRLKNSCIDCTKPISKEATRCKSCTRIDSDLKINWPPVEVILERLKTTPYIRLAKEYGVSDNAIRKHLKLRGIIPPKRLTNSIY